MPILRRLVILLFLIALPCTSRAQTLRRFPVVGAVTDSSATLMVWLAAEGSVAIEYGQDPSLNGSRRSARATLSAAQGFVAHIPIEGLMPAARYYYRAVDSSGRALGAIASFTTFPRAGADAPVSILFGSCQQSRPTDSGSVFKAASSLGGDLFIQLGDWTYPDRLVGGFPSAPGAMEASYALRLDTAYPFTRRTLASMGLVYAWDDHDYLGNNSHGGGPDSLKRSALAAYRRYIPSYNLPSEHGIWHSFVIGNAEVFVIDSRSQRSPADSAFVGNTFAPKPGHSMLAGYSIGGVDQRTWLLRAIRESKARWKILVSPVFFNPGSELAIPLALLADRKDVAIEFADKWIGYPADVDSMRALLAAGHGRNMLVISGDAHTNVYDDGTHSIVPEFMVGALDQTNSNLFATLSGVGFDVWTAGQAGTSQAIGRIRIETSPRHRLIVESFDTSGALLLRHTLEDSSSLSVDDAAFTGGTTARYDAGTLALAFRDEWHGDARVRLYATDGRMVGEYQAVCSGRGAQFTTGTLPNGAYTATIARAGRIITARFAVVR